MTLCLFRFVPEEEIRRADVDVCAPVAGGELEQLQLQRAGLLRIGMLVGGPSGQLGPLRLRKRRSGLRGGVHLLHRFGARSDGVEQRLGEQQVRIARERLLRRGAREVTMSGEELIEGLDVVGRSLGGSGGDADDAAFRSSGEERERAQRCERRHGSPPSSAEHRYAGGIPAFQARRCISLGEPGTAVMPRSGRREQGVQLTDDGRAFADCRGDTFRGG